MEASAIASRFVTATITPASAASAIWSGATYPPIWKFGEVSVGVEGPRKRRDGIVRTAVWGVPCAVTD
jgi:hypothetical protein